MSVSQSRARGGDSRPHLRLSESESMSWSGNLHFQQVSLMVLMRVVTEPQSGHATSEGWALSTQQGVQVGAFEGGAL